MKLQLNIEPHIKELKAESFDNEQQPINVYQNIVTFAEEMPADTQYAFNPMKDSNDTNNVSLTELPSETDQK